MNIEAKQHRIMQALLAREGYAWPSGADQERWEVYRDMVRARFFRVCDLALPRTKQAIGDKHFHELVEEWLDQVGPRSPLFRKLPVEFCEFAQTLIPSNPPWAKELATYEMAKWQCAYKDVELPQPRVLDFDKALLLNPTLVTLTFAHSVHDDEIVEQPTTLFCYRDSQDKIRTWQLVGFMKKVVLTQFEQSRLPLKEVVARSAAQMNEALSGEMIATLGDMLPKLAKAEMVFSVAGIE